MRAFGTKAAWAFGTILTISLLIGWSLVRFSRSGGVFDPETPRSDLNVIAISLTKYRYEYGTYPSSLVQLGPPRKGEKESASAAGLIRAELAAGKRLGYKFEYRAVDSKGSGVFDEFTVTADPISDKPSTGHYYLDETGIIRVETGSRATRRSPEG